MNANYLEGDARRAAIKQSEFLRQMYGDKVDLLLRGFLSGFADVLSERKGERYTCEYLWLVADELQAKQNKRERAA